MKYYTLFEGKKLLTNTTDDMNTLEEWSESGMVWTSKKLADECAKHWIEYDHDVTVVELTPLIKDYDRHSKQSL